MKRCVFLIALLLFSSKIFAENFPPGWLPVAELNKNTVWKDFREIDDRIHIYFPDKEKAVNGIFVCFVFHSADPREMADLWNFAMVTVPWPFNYDLGHNDKRNGRYKMGHPVQDMGLLLRYLESAASETKHPELKTVPIVGWLGQNGSHLGSDLYSKAPERLLAWSDSFPNRLRQYPEFTKNVPFPFAWEVNKKDLKTKSRTYNKDKGPHYDLSCRANTYGFEHGIYSKYNFFMFYMDRCIKLRMPEKMPEPGQPVKLKAALREEGWEGDFDPVSPWNPIASVKSAALKDAKYPVWFPDSYAAHGWRAYHSACTDIKICSPKFSYRGSPKGNEAQWGMGYGGFLSKDENHTFSVKLKSEFSKIEYFDGDQKLGESTGEPYELKGIKIEAGLRVLYAVGTKADGSKEACLPAIVIVR